MNATLLDTGKSSSRVFYAAPLSLQSYREASTVRPVGKEMSKHGVITYFYIIYVFYVRYSQHRQNRRGMALTVENSPTSMYCLLLLYVALPQPILLIFFGQHISSSAKNWYRYWYCRYLLVAVRIFWPKCSLNVGYYQKIHKKEYQHKT